MNSYKPQLVILEGDLSRYDTPEPLTENEVVELLGDWESLDENEQAYYLNNYPELNGIVGQLLQAAKDNAGTIIKKGIGEIKYRINKKKKKKSDNSQAAQAEALRQEQLRKETEEKAKRKKYILIGSGVVASLVLFKAIQGKRK